MVKNKVLVVGIDAMDPKIFNKLKEKLPNFNKLNYSKLKTSIPPETPVAWSAASTGTNPGKYGIYDFVNRNPENYRPKLNLAIESKGIVKTEYKSAMQGKPFWRILSENDINSVILRWPITFPAEEIKGKMLSGLGVVDLKGMLNSYSYYTDEEYNKDEEGSEKIIQIVVENNEIETYLSGPLIRKSSGVKDLQEEIKIKILDGDKISLEIKDKKVEIKKEEWSEFIKVKFKMGFLMEVHGIFKIYLMSIKPFKMYVGSMQVDPENQIVNMTYPKEYGKELVKNIGLFHTLGMPEDTKAVTENKISKNIFYRQVKEIESEREKIFFYEFNKFEEGVLAFVFDEGDRLKHIFWENKVLDDSEFKVAKEIEEYYINKDKFLGKILEKIDENTKLIVMSDHGFNSFERQVNINNWLKENEYLKIDGDSIDDVDWSKTKAYSLGFTSIYLNLEGRESKGIVKGDEIIDEIIEKLKNLEDNGNKVFTNIYKGSEIYHGEFAKDAPDIVVGFREGYRMSWKSATGFLDKEIISDNKGKWIGDHLIDASHVPGVLFTNFKINKEDPELIDITPTILELIGVKIPENIDGKGLV
jgi:predicted AlkP superfamily phosphohydrolase/phosphomutase